MWKFKLVLVSAIICLAVFPALSAGDTDELGYQVQLGAAPKRIISLSPAITEILFALGLGNEVAGVTEFSDYPPEAKLKPIVGSYVDLNLEQVISLHPDLIIATADGNRKETVEKLKNFGLAVFVINPRSFQDILDTMLNIGRITGKLEAAQRLVNEISRNMNRIAKLTAPLKKPRIFLQLEANPLITAGRDTFWDHLISLAGGENIAQAGVVKYPRYSWEAVVAAQPEIIIVTSMSPQFRQEELIAPWRKWSAIPAVKNNKVYTIDPDLVDRPGPRIIQGLERLARIIHPEAF